MPIRFALPFHIAMASGTNDCREVHRHTPYYCEENVYWLARSVISEQARGGEEESDKSYFAVVVSNPKKAVPMWQQKAGEEAMCGLVVWDYHVFLLECSGSESYAIAAGEGSVAGQPLPCKATRVYDLDTRLSFPCDAKDYFEHSFAFNEEKLQQQGFDQVSAITASPHSIHAGIGSISTRNNLFPSPHTHTHSQVDC